MKLDKTELGWAAARNVCKEAGADLPLVKTILITMMMMVIIIILIKMISED